MWLGLSKEITKLNQDGLEIPGVLDTERCTEGAEMKNTSPVLAGLVGLGAWLGRFYAMGLDPNVKRVSGGGWH